MKPCRDDPLDSTGNTVRGLCAAGLAWSGMLFVVALCLVSAHSIRPVAASKGVVPCRSVIIIVSRPWTPANTAAAAETQLLAELVRHGRLVRAGVAGRSTPPAGPAAPAAATTTAAATAASAAAPASSAAAAARHRFFELPVPRTAPCCLAALALPAAALQWISQWRGWGGRRFDSHWRRVSVCY